ncbi:MAG: hypothetical protein IJ373_04185 [Clostridia bacterium]|nr:hypothetical protein [Clostridia bacterium]
MEKVLLKNWRISGSKYTDVAANVPGDVLNDLYVNGLIDDPLYGDNLRRMGDVFDSDWTYVSRFDIPETLYKQQRIILTFEGIDTISEITLNGKRLGETKNMFLRYDYDIKEYVKEKDNELTVKIFSAARYGREHQSKYRTLFSNGRLMLRKAQCQFGWDWAPCCPTMGIWLPCYITGGHENRMRDIQLRTTNDGDVSFIVTLDKKGGAYYADKNFALRITLDGKVTEYHVTQHCRLVNCKIENPKLWWPNGYGEPNLYPYKVELLLDGECIEEKTGKVGLKEIRILEKAQGTDCSNFMIEVNGTVIFAKGSNWVPVSATLGAATAETYEKLIGFAKDAYYNILRVWGGGIYETEYFYDLCDENGILVWQDFAFACSEIPFEQDFVDNVKKEAEYQVKRIRKHASLCLFCGCSEVLEWGSNLDLLRYTLRGFVTHLAPNIPYIYDSPSSWTDNTWDPKTGDSHDSCMQKCLDAGDFKNFREYIAKNKGYFLSECTALGSSRLRSLRRFAPKKALKTDSEILEYHFVENPYLPDPKETFLMKEKRYAEGFFGDVSTMEKFVRKSMIAHAEILAAEIAYARSRKGECNGFMNWMYNDTWGCGTWAVVDYYLERKPAYYFQKHAYEPCGLYFIQENGSYYLCVINDTDKELKGVMTYINKTLDGGGLDGDGMNVCIPPHSAERVPVQFCEGTVYTSAGLLTEDGQSLGTKFFPNGWDYPWKTDVRAEVIETEENGEFVYLVSILANEYARTLFVDTPNNRNVTFSDNFIDIEKGFRAEIVLRSKEKIDVSDITIKTFADEWKD